MDTLTLKGRWTVECFDPDGSLAWRDAFDNMTTNAGVTDVLAVYLGGATQKTAWYLGLIDAAGFASLAAGDVMTSHPGWTESTAYTGARPAWVPGSAVGGSITNPTPINFAMNATVTIRGAFVASDATAGGTAGLLFATGQFGSPQSVVSGQNLKISYTCSGTGS